MERDDLVDDVQAMAARFRHIFHSPTGPRRLYCSV